MRTHAGVYIATIAAIVIAAAWASAKLVAVTTTAVLTSAAVGSGTAAAAGIHPAHSKFLLSGWFARSLSL